MTSEPDQDGRERSTQSATAGSLQAQADAREQWKAMIQRRADKGMRALKRQYGNQVRDGGKRR